MLFRTLCKQTGKTLIRRRVERRLIWSALFAYVHLKDDFLTRYNGLMHQRPPWNKNVGHMMFDKQGFLELKRGFLELKGGFRCIKGVRFAKFTNIPENAIICSERGFT